MHLSELTDKLETDFEKERNIILQNVIEVVQDALHVNLYEATKTNKPLDAFNSSVFLLLNKFKDALYYSLEASNIEIAIFQREVILSIILGITRNKSNTNFLINILIDKNIINSYYEEDKTIIMDTLLGLIKFRMADDIIIDDKVKSFIKDNIDITSSCHESTLFLLENNKDYLAVTSICRKNLNSRYFHSFILEGDYVIDLTSNLYMKKSDYYKLYGVEEIRVVNYIEFLKDSKKCAKYDESKTLFPLLRNAIYYYSKNGKYKLTSNRNNKV